MTAAVAPRRRLFLLQREHLKVEDTREGDLMARRVAWFEPFAVDDPGPVFDWKSLVFIGRSTFHRLPKSACNMQQRFAIFQGSCFAAEPSNASVLTATDGMQKRCTIVRNRGHVHLCLLHSSPLPTYNVGLYLPVNSEKVSQAGQVQAVTRTHILQHLAGTGDKAAGKALVEHARYNCTHCVAIRMQAKAGRPPVHIHTVACQATNMSAGQPALRITHDKR